MSRVTVRMSDDFIRHLSTEGRTMEPGERITVTRGLPEDARLVDVELDAPGVVRFGFETDEDLPIGEVRVEHAQRRDFPPSGCPTTEDVIAYYEGGLTEAMDDFACGHLARCAGCAALLYEVDGFVQRDETPEEINPKTMAEVKRIPALAVDQSAAFRE